LLPPKPPARHIPLSRRSHIIGFQPLPTGTAAHESALERDFVTLTAFVDPLAIIRSQPVTISFNDGAINRHYTPDFLVQHESGAELIEVKYERDLRERWSELAGAFEAAEKWARERHGTFRVLTERDIRGQLVENAKRLLPLRTAAIDSKMAMLALTQAYALQRPSFGSLLAALPDRPLALATLWRLIAQGQLRTDLTFQSPSIRSCAQYERAAGDT
jgi:hypothetical protein